MSERTSNLVPLTLLFCVGFIVAAAVAYSVSASNELPDGPVAVVWDKAPCAACGMHVGEPPFAAQLTTKTGETLVFDDPGCLFLHLAENEIEVHSMYFRHVREERWVRDDAVAFTPLEPTPMGFGIGAVDAGAANSMTFEQARNSCIDRVASHRQR